MEGFNNGTRTNNRLPPLPRKSQTNLKISDVNQSPTLPSVAFSNLQVWNSHNLKLKGMEIGSGSGGGGASTTLSDNRNPSLFLLPTDNQSKGKIALPPPAAPAPILDFNESPIRKEIATGGCRRLDLTNMDPKRLKRIDSNRLSAQRCRLKRLQHNLELEEKAKSLEAYIAVTAPQVGQLRNRLQSLQMEAERLSMEMTIMTNKKTMSDAELERNRAEVYRLKALYALQQQQKQLCQELTPTTTFGQGNPEQQMFFPHSVAGNMSYGNTENAQFGEIGGLAMDMNELNMSQPENQTTVGQAWMASDGSSWMMPPPIMGPSVAPTSSLQLPVQQNFDQIMDDDHPLNLQNLNSINN